MDGIELRDYFAAAALKGLLPKLPLVDQLGEHGESVGDKIAHNRDIAESCYWLADAMLEARERQFMFPKKKYAGPPQEPPKGPHPTEMG